MDNKNLTLGEYLDWWLETVVKGTNRYNTYVSYEGYTRNHIKRLIGGIPLAEMKTIEIQQFIGKLTEEKRLCARTVGAVAAMLRAALTFAEDCGYIDKNPYRRIKLPKVEEAETDTFTNEEQAKIERVILDSEDNRCYGILLALYTGVRIGELCALKWENVDVESRRIQIKISLNRSPNRGNGSKKTKMEEREPKTRKSKREIRIPGFLCNILLRIKAESKSAYVFSMRNGRFVNPRTMQFLFRRILEKAKVSPRRFHSLRHAFTVRALEIGVDVKTVSDTLGHADATVTLNRYAHSLDEQKLRMSDHLNSYFNDRNTGAFV